MKKFNILRILLQAILIFLTCLIIAVIIKDAFNIDADYLTASATFFAAFTAFMLFNDWREEFLIMKIPELHASLVAYSNKISKLIIAPTVFNNPNFSLQDQEKIKNSFSSVRDECLEVFNKLNEIGQVFKSLEQYCDSKFQMEITEHQQSVSELSNSIFQFYFDSNKGMNLLIDVTNLDYWIDLDSTIRGIHADLVKLNWATNNIFYKSISKG